MRREARLDALESKTGSSAQYDAVIVSDGTEDESEVLARHGFAPDANVLLILTGVPRPGHPSVVASWTM